MLELLFVPRPPDSSSPAPRVTHVCRTANVFGMAVFMNWGAGISFALLFSVTVEALEEWAWLWSACKDHKGAETQCHPKTVGSWGRGWEGAGFFFIWSQIPPPSMGRETLGPSPSPGPAGRWTVRRQGLRNQRRVSPASWTFERTTLEPMDRLCLGWPCGGFQVTFTPAYMVFWKNNKNKKQKNLILSRQKKLKKWFSE